MQPCAWVHEWLSAIPDIDAMVATMMGPCPAAPAQNGETSQTSYLPLPALHADALWRTALSAVTMGCMSSVMGAMPD
jgi:hypothetical protein